MSLNEPVTCRGEYRSRGKNKWVPVIRLGFRVVWRGDACETESIAAAAAEEHFGRVMHGLFYGDET